MSVCTTTKLVTNLAHYIILLLLEAGPILTPYSLVVR